MPTSPAPSRSRRAIASVAVALSLALAAGSTGFLAAPPIVQGATAWTSPEGTRIEVDSAGPWTVAQIHRMLLENGLDGALGPTLTVRVQDTIASQTGSAASTSGGRYVNFQAVIYLKGINSNFSVSPDAILAHELGHAWTLRHLYLTQQNDWSSYLAFRGLVGDSRLDTTYNWSTGEMIADDYRHVMGSDAARAEMPGYINSDIAHPSTIEGFEAWFRETWAGGEQAPSPTATPTPWPSPTITPVPTTTPAPVPAPTASPGGTATPTPTPAPSLTPTPLPSASAQPTDEPAAIVVGLEAEPAVVVSSTRLTIDVTRTASITMTIVDARGLVVRRLLQGTLAAGRASVLWDRRNDGGQRVRKGSYRVEVRATTALAADLDVLGLTVK
jgi:cell division septation protein DedD